MPSYPASPTPVLPPASPPTSRPTRRLVRLVILGVVLAGLYNYQWFIDQYVLETYKAPAEVAALSAPLALTRQGQAILDRARPQIDDKAAFNADCQTQHGDLELGCYVGGRIYILRIDNTSLKPEMETVLAHELLHAAWARLRPSARKALGNELEPIYHAQNDGDLTARMTGYATSEPGEETNELHSILGTEVAALGNPSLEKHYAVYFGNRGAIVAAHAAYELVFTTQRNQLAAQLATIKGLKAQLTALNGRMDVYKANGQIAAYNGLVATQNGLVDRVNRLIDSYDSAVDIYNSLSASIDSHQLTTEPGV